MQMQNVTQDDCLGHERFSHFFQRLSQKFLGNIDPCNVFKLCFNYKHCTNTLSLINCKCWKKLSAPLTAVAGYEEAEQEW